MKRVSTKKLRGALVEKYQAQLERELPRLNRNYRTRLAALQNVLNQAERLRKAITKRLPHGYNVNEWKKCEVSAPLYPNLPDRDERVLRAIDEAQMVGDRQRVDELVKALAKRWKLATVGGEAA